MMTDNKNTRPLCPKCGHPMGKAGGGVSGKRMCQSYRCSQCLTTWLNVKEDYIRKVVQRK